MVLPKKIIALLFYGGIVTVPERAPTTYRRIDWSTQIGRNDAIELRQALTRSRVTPSLPVSHYFKVRGPTTTILR